jgi:hypothetical protein
VLSIWSHGRLWSEVKTAYEMIPYLPNPKESKFPQVTLADAAGKSLGAATTTPAESQVIRIDQGGYGVEIRLEKPLPVLLGASNTVLIQLATEGKKPTPAAEVHLKYQLRPFRN